MEIINIISIVLEVVVAIFALMMAIEKKHVYGWGIALTFLVYVFYDLNRTLKWGVSDTTMALSFLVASSSAVVSIYLIYKKQN